ncbi:hypothetical protein [Desulfocastanea catecholica]
MFLGLAYSTWVTIGLFVASLAISCLTRPKPENSNPSAGEIEVPTAEEGSVIPVLFGTRNLEGMNVVWYGDVRVVPIKKSGGKK